MALIQADIVGDQIAFRFSMFCDGLTEWAQEETGSTWQPTFPAWKPGGWAYTMPATNENAARLLLTAPTAVDCSPALKAMVGKIADEDFFAASSPMAAGKLEQPATRVFDCWGNQLQAYHFAKRRKWRAGLAMKMGTGKSKVAIDSIVNNGAKKVLILCPASVLGVWRKQFREHGPQIDNLILGDDYTVIKKRQLATNFFEAAKFVDAPGRTFAAAINYESAIRSDFANWATRQQWDAIILDEAHRAKNPNGATGTLIAKLRLVSAMRLALSGTFMPHSPADLFSPFRFVDPSIFGDNFYVYLKRYAITGSYGEFLGWRRKSELRQRYHQGAIVIGDEFLGMPAIQHIEIEFDLPRKSQLVYDELWEDFCTYVGAGRVTVDNALVKLLRAQQITSGYLPLDEMIGEDDDPGDKIEILNDVKAELLRDRLRDIPDGDPVVVFCKYRYDLERVRAVVESLEWERNDCKVGDAVKRDKQIAAGDWRPFRCGEVSGDRKDLTPDATLPTGFAVFAVQEQSGGVGVDFTRACIAFMYSIGFSLGNYDQMLARLRRPGQTRPVRIYHLIARRTVDRQIRVSLNTKKKVTDSISEAITAGTLRAWAQEAA